MTLFIDKLKSLYSFNKNHLISFNWGTPAPSNTKRNNFFFSQTKYVISLISWENLTSVRILTWKHLSAVVRIPNGTLLGSHVYLTFYFHFWSYPDSNTWSIIFQKKEKESSLKLVLTFRMNLWSRRFVTILIKCVLRHSGKKKKVFHNFAVAFIQF